MSTNGRHAPVVLVTGATGGLGRQIALRFSKEGGRVALQFRSDAAAARRIRDLCLSAEGDAILVQGDLCRDQDCRRIAEEVTDQFGRIDTLVNNAAITERVDHENLEGMRSEAFRNILDTNVVAAFQMIRAVAPHLAESGAGSVVNVSSASGIDGMGSSIAYAASKAALNVMTFSLARALAPAIRVNAICPAFIENEWMLRALGESGYEDLKRKVTSRTPLRRAATTEDIANAVLWLARDAVHLTGELLRMDGGLHLGSRLVPTREA